MVPMPTLIAGQSSTSNSAITLNAAGANFWFNKWSKVTSRKSTDVAAKKYLAGV